MPTPRGPARQPLRRRAEKRLQRGTAAAAPRLDGDARRLLHELQVHEIELELQNEELRGARHELERALERYTEIFAFAPIGYAVLEREDKIMEINHAGATLLGQNRTKLVGRPLGGFVVPQHQATLLALLRGARETAVTLKDELELGDEAGRRLTVAFTANVLPAGTTILLAFEDVTAPRTNERKLAQAQAALRAADRRKDEFLATLSHELRNPLAPIRSSLMLLSMKGAAKRPARTKEAHAVISRQVAHLSRLVDDLLDVTRIAHGKVQLQLADVELRRLLRECARDHAADFSRRGVALQTRLGAQDLWVRGDPTRVAQAISNVLGNALKFTAPGGHVTLAARLAGDRVEITVSDDGAGIDAEYLPHLFEPFSQGPRQSDGTWGGVGLGLAMVKGLVELHQGNVAVTSDGPGRGTRVTLLLPRGAASEITSARKSTLRMAKRRRRVLVIDDNADAADSLQAVLETVGHQVRVARDGRSGIALARSYRPEVILCDIGLPDLDGYAVARALRADATLGGTSLVALTGYGREQDIEKALKSGFDRHLTKPPELKHLLGLLETAPGPARARG
jgi:two-component system CheB/CheR fusion protein